MSTIDTKSRNQKKLSKITNFNYNKKNYYSKNSSETRKNITLKN